VDEYVYFNGQRIARRDSANTVFYYLQDHLGSSRMIVQAGQTNACYEADYYPFGGERMITNTCPQNYKSTGQERDAESALAGIGVAEDRRPKGQEPEFWTQKSPQRVGTPISRPCK
jgi:hypothetical protein